MLDHEIIMKMICAVLIVTAFVMLKIRKDSDDE